MNWRITQVNSRQRYLTKFDQSETRTYHLLVGKLDKQVLEAYRLDINRAFIFSPEAKVLDVGAGSGAMCRILIDQPGIQLTALEPSWEMLALLKTEPELERIETIAGFCDAPEDRKHFQAASFDAIVSRQLINGLFDPIAAFENWRHWLKPGGHAIMIDGFYERSAWTGRWAEETDTLPLAACQSLAMVPYLLEKSGFQINVVEPMHTVNSLPSTKTPRYLVVAQKTC